MSNEKGKTAEEAIQHAAKSRFPVMGKDEFDKANLWVRSKFVSYNEYNSFYKHAQGNFIKGAKSEAAREYWASQFQQPAPQQTGGMRWVKAEGPPLNGPDLHWRFADTKKPINNQIAFHPFGVYISHTKKGSYKYDEIEYLDESATSSPVVGEGDGWILASVALPEVIMDGEKRKVKRTYIETSKYLYKAYYYPKKFKMCEWEEFDEDNIEDLGLEIIDGEYWLKEGWWMDYEHGGEYYEDRVENVLRWKYTYKPEPVEESATPPAKGEQPEETNLGICKEKGCTRQAVVDYNGHNYFVCREHMDSLSREFDRDFN